MVKRERKGNCGRIAILLGKEKPAMSISYEPPTDPYNSGFMVIYADSDPDTLDDSHDDVELVCLHCLAQDGDVQLGRGLDLARKHGQVDWDVELEEWFVPTYPDSMVFATTA